jgi:hypothetical protein
VNDPLLQTGSLGDLDQTGKAIGLALIEGRDGKRNSSENARLAGHSLCNTVRHAMPALTT